jgi:predicted kinase
LWLDCAEDIRRLRVAARRNDASDADAAVVQFQSAFAPVGDWAQIDAGGEPAAVLAAARRFLA